MHHRNTYVPCLQSDQTHLNQRWLSLTVYDNTSWRQNVTDIFDILYWYWIFFPMEPVCMYTAVVVYYVFFAYVEILAKMGSVHCIATYLPWYFRQSKRCDGVAVADAPQLFNEHIYLALSPSSLCLPLSKCCMVLTWPSECSQLTTLIFGCFCTFFHVCQCVRDVSTFFH